jgi:chromosome segregation ATPase
MSTEKNMDGGTFGDETIGITSDDLVLKLGQQLIDLINKDKVIAALSKNMKAIGDARVALAGELDKSRADASQVNEDKASLEAQIDRLKKSRGEIKDDHSRAYSALKTKSRETESKLKEQSREQLEAANKLLGQLKADNAQLKADNAKVNQRHADELQKMNDEIITYKLEIQSLKDKNLPSNGASRVVKTKPKKQGRKYTKKAAKTTASA